LAAGLSPHPLGELQRSPTSLAVIEGVLLLRGGRERKGEGKGGEGKR